MLKINWKHESLLKVCRSRTTLMAVGVLLADLIVEDLRSRFDQDGVKTADLTEHLVIMAAKKKPTVTVDSQHLPLKKARTDW